MAGTSKKKKDWRDHEWWSGTEKEVLTTHTYFTEASKYSKRIFAQDISNLSCSHLNHHLPDTGSPSQGRSEYFGLWNLGITKSK